MALVPHTVTALAESDADGTDGKNIVAGAVVTLKDTNDNTVIMYDDSAGSNPSTSKVTGSNGQVSIFVEPGVYNLSVNGQSSDITVGQTSLLSVVNVATLTSSKYALGSTVLLQGYYELGDGGGGEGTIQTPAEYGQTPDELGLAFTLTDGNIWVRTITGRLNIEWFGAREGQDSSVAIRAAMESGPCFVPAKKYLYDGTIVNTDNVDILGEQMPVVNDDNTQLLRGSIIVRTLTIRGKNPTIRNLGIDNGIVEFPDPSDDEDGLVLAHRNPGDQSTATVQNVIGLTREVESPFHAILCEGHQETNLTNVTGIKSFFGCALKNTNCNVDGLTVIENGNSNLIIKSDTISGKSKRVNVTNVVAVGAGNAASPNTGFNIRIQSLDEDIEEINISNVVGSNSANGLYIDSQTVGSKSAASLNLNNVTFRDPAVGLLIDGGTDSGQTFDVKLSNVSVIDAVNKIADIKGFVRSLKVDTFYGSVLSTSSFVNQAFTIDSNVRSVSIDQFELVQDKDWNTRAALVIDANYVPNQFGSLKCDVKGAGIPRPGYSFDTTSGLNITVNPVFDSSKWSSLIDMQISSATSINEINREMNTGTRFPYNYNLTIINNGSDNLTINHNPGGFIFNRDNLNVVLNPNEIVKYVFFNAVWHQV